MTRKMQFCFMITYDVVTSESDRDAKSPMDLQLFSENTEHESKGCVSLKFYNFL